MASIRVAASSALKTFTVDDIQAHPDAIPADTLFVKYKDQPKIFIFHSEEVYSNRLKLRNDQLNWCGENIANNFRKLKYERREGFILKNIPAIDVLRCMCKRNLRGSYFDNGGRDHYSDIILCLQELYPDTFETHIFAFIGYSESEQCFVWTSTLSPTLWHICLDTIAIANMATMLRVLVTGNILDTMPDETARLSVDRFSIVNPLPRVTNVQKLFRYAGNAMRGFKVNNAKQQQDPATPASKRSRPPRVIDTASTSASDAATASSSPQHYDIFRPRSRSTTKSSNIDSATSTEHVSAPGTIHTEIQGDIVGDAGNENSDESSSSDESESEDEDLILDPDEDDYVENTSEEAMEFAYAPIEDNEPVCGVKISAEKLYTTCIIASAQASSRSCGQVTGTNVQSNLEYAKSLKDASNHNAERRRFLFEAMRNLKRRHSMLQQEYLALVHMDEQVQTECNDLYNHIGNTDMTKSTLQVEHLQKKRHIDSSTDPFKTTTAMPHVV